MPIYEIRSLEHSYGDRTVVTIEHLTVQPGSILGLIGPNGSGKSTLLRLLGLIERPTRGKIYFNGRLIEPFSDEARFLITLLPQEPFLMKRSVFNNVSYGLKLRGNGSNITARVNEALVLVGLPSHDFARRPWYALSGGEAQRVALAARLALKPKALLLDEPTASVDAASAQLIKEASLRARQELGTTLIVASHDWQWLYEICDEVLHLFKGRIFGTGRETIIFGPWQKLGTGKWGKILSDKQQLRVPAPPDQEAAAVIDVLSVSEDGATIADENIVLRGIVSRLSLEKKTGQLFATILVGDLPFTVRLRPQQNKEHDMFPGNTISIRYRLDQIKWI
ncbi:MAG: ABC transporter ATP-binding protein [Deltaproteobacteria bacterium]|nr:MAG: ABC transporter ATP-binding protein [Deltaproteobacteria bacterium]